MAVGRAPAAPGLASRLSTVNATSMSPVPPRMPSPEPANAARGAAAGRDAQPRACSVRPTQPAAPRLAGGIGPRNTKTVSCSSHGGHYLLSRRVVQQEIGSARAGPRRDRNWQSPGPPGETSPRPTGMTPESDLCGQPD